MFNFPYYPFIPRHPYYNHSFTYAKKESPSRENNSAYDDSHIFEIMGIKLYFDDLIILIILYLLYSQNVYDDMLYIILLLLLLS